METTDKAKQYAETISANVIKDAIENAFKAGYQVGYEDGLKERERMTPPPACMPEFIDLGIHSDILWASDFLRDENGNILYLSYEEASQYQLPSASDWKRLWYKSDRKEEYNYYSPQSCYLSKLSFLGPTGRSLELNVTPIKRLGEFNDHYKLTIPLQKESDDDSAYCARVYLTDEKERKSTYSFKHFFKGYTVPVLIVKKKEQ